MEADWSAEIAPGLPRIIVPWSAESTAQDPASTETLTWQDLRLAGPQLDAAIQSIPAAAQESALAAALRTLHAPGSPWFTSKCDLWTAAPHDPANLNDPANPNDPPDPYEFDAADLVTAPVTYPHPAPLHLCASYLDILSSNPALFASFPAHEKLLNQLIATLRNQPQPHARVDLILRAARIHATDGFAFTAYAAGCGLTAPHAHHAWRQALARLIHALQTCPLPNQ